jgi:hypothetical protein
VVGETLAEVEPGRPGAEVDVDEGTVGVCAVGEFDGLECAVGDGHLIAGLAQQVAEHGGHEPFVFHHKESAGENGHAMTLGRTPVRARGVRR